MTRVLGRFLCVALHTGWMRRETEGDWRRTFTGRFTAGSTYCICRKITGLSFGTFSLRCTTPLHNDTSEKNVSLPCEKETHQKVMSHKAKLQ